MTNNIGIKNSDNSLSSGLLKQIIRLGFPVAIQSALVAILALADVLMVSNFGKEATAAVGIASKWHFVAIMIMAGLASANGTLVAQYWGRDDAVSAKTVTGIAIRFGLKVLIPVTLIITVGSELIMRLQTNDTQVIELRSAWCRAPSAARSASSRPTSRSSPTSTSRPVARRRSGRSCGS